MYEVGILKYMLFGISNANFSKHVIFVYNYFVFSLVLSLYLKAKETL